MVISNTLLARYEGKSPTLFPLADDLWDLFLHDGQSVYSVRCVCRGCDGKFGSLFYPGYSPISAGQYGHVGGVLCVWIVAVGLYACRYGSGQRLRVDVCGFVEDVKEVASV